MSSSELLTSLTPSPPYWLAGVDGCPAGWIVALALLDLNHDLTRLRFVLCPRVEAVLNVNPKPEIVSIDMPIGLLDTRNPVVENVIGWLAAYFAVARAAFLARRVV